MIRTFAIFSLLVLCGSQVHAQGYPPIADERPGIIPIPIPLPVSPPPLPFSANISAEAETGPINITTSGFVNVTQTDPSVYLGDIGANWYHMCFASDSFYDTTGVGGSIDVIGTIQAGVWEYLGKATVFGSLARANISGDGYGVVTTGGFHFYTISGFGQVTFEVDYDLKFESTNIGSNPGSYSTAWIELENMGGGSMQSDTETLNQSSSVTTKSGVLSVTRSVSGTQDVYFMAATDTRAYSVWNTGCP